MRLSRRNVSIWVAGGLLVSAGLLASVASIALGETNPSFGQRIKADLGDYGPASSIESLQVEIPVLLRAQLEWGNLTNDQVAKILAEPNSEFTKQWETQAHHIWVALEAKKQISAVTEMFRQQGDYRIDNSWKALKVKIEDWQGIQIDGDFVTAQYVQVNEYHLARGIVVSDPIQWRATFKISNPSGELLMVDRKGVNLNTGE